MDVNGVNTYVMGASDKITGVSGFLANTVSWLFTMKNIFFFVIIAIIIWVAYYLYKQETMSKRYYFNRNREV